MDQATRQVVTPNQALTYSEGPMGTKIPIPQMDKMDWDAYEFLQGPGSFGKEYNHPLWKFGTLNKFDANTGWKLQSGKYHAITEETDKQLQEDYGIVIGPRDVEPFDDQGRLHYRECIHFWMTNEFYASIQKVNLLKALGHQPAVQARTNQMVSGALAASRGRFTERDLNIKVTEEYNHEKLASEQPITEKEKNFGASMEAPEKLIGI